ncbi:PEP-utilizing enzyme [Sporichthya brevicatena]|uniref:PEP-utilizing enzyme n=1 Tax=Sporichthya brevicatena TaxID=171442 RepID=A0ABN1GSJ2_9ACTN
MSELVQERVVTAISHDQVAAPGSGTWVLDAGHCPRPVCRFAAPLFRTGFQRGFGETFARYGVLLDHMDVAIVRGFIYNQLRALGAPPEAVNHPPKEVFDQILAGSPPHQERLATADLVWATRRWREDLDRWDTLEKPARNARRDALDAVDLASLSDEELLEHLAVCRDEVIEGWYVHHRYNGAALLPVGDYVVHALRWTGRSPSELLMALAGTSPVSSGGGPELAVLAAAVRDDPAAQILATAERDPAEIVAALAGWPGAVGEAFAAYERVVRFLAIEGEDSIGMPCTIEEPELMVSRLRAALDAPAVDPAQTAAAAACAAIRAAVPPEHRAEFDDLLAEARLVYRMRDERAVHGDRAIGTVTRRALLEVGRRLVQRQLLDAPDHAVDLDLDEVASLLRDGSGPDTAEVARRVFWRLSADYREMPPIFGEVPGPPLPAEWLPPAAARIHIAFGFAIDAVLSDIGPAAAAEDGVVTGMPVGGGVREGTAKVLRGADDLDRIEPGDILVTTSTGPAFNLVLPMLAGLVTDRGGLLSHAAIVAREFALPAVVGCAIATISIPDGARVRIDGDAGTVTLL